MIQHPVLSSEVKSVVVSMLSRIPDLSPQKCLLLSLEGASAYLLLEAALVA